MSLEPAPTPEPLLEMDTVASSKLHEDAADAIVAPERRREETKLLRTFILAVQERVNVEFVVDGAKGHARALRGFVGLWPVLTGVLSSCQPSQLHHSNPRLE